MRGVVALLREPISRWKYTAVGGVAVAAVSLLCPSSYCEGEERYRSGGVKLEVWKAKHPNFLLLDLENEVIQRNVTKVRDRETTAEEFVHYAKRLLETSLEFALCDLIDTEDVITVESTSGVLVEGIDFEPNTRFCGITLRSSHASTLLFRQVFHHVLPPGSLFGELMVNPSDKDATTTKFSEVEIPKEIAQTSVIILSLELASIHQVEHAIRLLRAHGVAEEKIVVLTLATCPSAADEFCSTFDKARLISISFDAKADEKGGTFPGFGDFLARYEKCCPAESPAWSGWLRSKIQS